MKLNFRNLLIGLVIVIVLAVVLLRGDQLVELIETIKKGAVIPLIAAVCTQLGKYFAQSFSYSYCFEAVDEHMNPRETLPLVFGTFFVNTIAPSLNLAGTTLVVDDARRRGIPPGRATSAALLMQITVDSGFATIMLIGFGILAATVGLSPLWFLLGLVVIGLVTVMVLILVLGRKRPALVLKALRPVERLVDRILVRFKKKPLDPWVERIVGSFSDAAGLIAHNPKTTAKAFGCSIAASACELACFSLVGVAFGAHSPEALICGYVVATLFAMISITPQGVGVVEAAVVVAFTSFGVSGAAGLSIALVYRGIVFWMPFLIGAILIQTAKTFKHDAKKVVRDKKGKDSLQGAAVIAKRLDEKQSGRPATAQHVSADQARVPESAAGASADAAASEASTSGTVAASVSDPPSPQALGSSDSAATRPHGGR